MNGPLYRKVADDLRRRIESGRLAEGEQLATEDELMESYHTSRSTIRAALKELTTRGLVNTLHGKGTFVTKQVNPIVTTLTSDPKTGGGGGEGLVYTAEVAASGRSATTGRLRLEIMNANPEIAHSLGIKEGTTVICRHEDRYVDDKPWSVQTSYYPWSLYNEAPGLLNNADMAEGTVSYLAERGIRQVGYRDTVAVRVPNMEETEYFDLPADGRIQVVEIYRVAFDQEQRRVRLTITVYPADRNRFVINVGDVPVSDELAAGGPEAL
ncbi:MAG TPA: GntR family transcriptional regulator [Streptosporangiaceae bacterium]